MTRPLVAVIGAGPAGSTAARLLASHDVRVVLFEARRLPRDKSCAGGLTPKAQRLVPPTALRTIERRLRAVELRGGRLPPLLVDEQAVEIAMVQRAAFDFALADAAAVAGADVRDGERVDDVVEEEDRVTVMTRHGRTRVRLRRRSRWRPQRHEPPSRSGS